LPEKRSSKIATRRGPAVHAATKKLFIYAYVLIDEAIRHNATKSPHEQDPSLCSDAEVLTIAIIRHRSDTVSSRSFSKNSTATGHSSSITAVSKPIQPSARWLWTPSSSSRAPGCADPGRRLGRVDTTALPVMHPYGCAVQRLERPDGLVALFSRYGAHAEWF
jgi:hypothetical protein